MRDDKAKKSSRRMNTDERGMLMAGMEKKGEGFVIRQLGGNVNG